MGVARLFGTLFRFLIAVAAAFIAASVFHTQMVLGELIKAGADIPMALRIETTLGDIAGFFPLFPVVIGVALLIGFIIAAVVRKFLTPLAGVAYPIAGAAAVALMLTLMSMQFYGTTPIAGARGAIGFGLQMLAGGFGGWVFAFGWSRA